MRVVVVVVLVTLLLLLPRAGVCRCARAVFRPERLRPQDWRYQGWHRREGFEVLGIPGHVRVLNVARRLLEGLSRGWHPAADLEPSVW